MKQHKRRANILWVALLVLILSYAVWIFIKTYKRRKNPSINLRLEASEKIALDGQLGAVEI